MFALNFTTKKNKS